MNSFRLLVLFTLGHLVWAADNKVPPVLKPTEPSDSVMVTLPGLAKPKAAQPAPAPAKTEAPAPLSGSIPPANPPSAPATVASNVPPLAPKPVVESSPKSFLPPDLQKEVAVFCQRLIGQWTQEDAQQLLGKPLRNRPSYDEKKVVNGRIYAFADPSGRYRELELDFEQNGGTLRTVFAYPKQMTWQDCRRRWNGEVSEADAQQGRTFYSYINRRLDVLVDARGKVISLGLY